MTVTARTMFGYLTVVVLGSVLLLTACRSSQAGEGSPSDLIRLLTEQTSQGRTAPSTGIFTCGSLRTESQRKRTIAMSLVMVGPSSLPDLERALDSIERDGMDSIFAPGSGWLSYVYAKVGGPAAYPRLRRMLGNPNLASLQNALGTSVALSLGLTSYVHGSRDMLAHGVHQCTEGASDAVTLSNGPCPPGSREVPIESAACGGPDLPRDALDRFILAWVWRDLPRLQGTIGPSAKRTLDTLLQARAWPDLGNELWHGRLGGEVGIGYRFKVSGPWSEPEETLTELQDDADPRASLANVELDTVFRSDSDGDCGTYRVKFVQIGTPADSTNLRYVVDNSDLGELLRLVAACATERGKKR